MCGTIFDHILTYTVTCCKAFSVLTSANIISLLCGFNPFQVYRDSEVIPMVCCDVCEKWVHIECDGIRSVKRLIPIPFQ
jgi:hypothetical protein